MGGGPGGEPCMGPCGYEGGARVRGLGAGGGISSSGLTTITSFLSARRWGGT